MKRSNDISTVRFGFRSIYFKLVVVYILITVIPMAITTFASLNILTEHETSNLRNASVAAADEAKRLLVQQVSQASKIANWISTDAAIAANMKDGDLQDLLSTKGEIWFPATVEIFSETGLSLSRHFVPGSDAEDFFTPDGAFIVEETLNLAIIADFFVSPRGLAVKATAPIIDISTLDIKGAVVVTYPLNHRFLLSVRDQLKCDISLIYHPDGRMISSFTNQTNLPRTKAWAGALNDFSLDRQITRDEVILNNRYAISYLPLLNDQNRAIGLLAATVNFTSLENQQAFTIRLIILSALISLICAVFLGVLTAFYFMYPVKLMLNAMREVSNGFLEKRVQLRRQDEFGAMAGTFNKMASTLMTNRDDLLKAAMAKDEYAEQLALFNNELENQVESRTRELREANIKLKELDQLKTNFLSTVSHELRTPLTSVLGFAKIIRKKLNDIIFPLIDDDLPRVKRNMKQIRNNLTIILSEGQRLTSLINDLLDISKMEAGEVLLNLEPVNLGRILKRAQDSVASLLLKRPELKMETMIDTPLPKVMGDKDRLMQVFINLLSNAIKFTPEGTITCSVFADHEKIYASVKDSGIGIDQKDLYKVFDKFRQVGETLTNKPRGTGLGLPICKQIIHYHGGQIWVESTLGLGSTFQFSLDLSPVSQSTKKPARETPSARVSST